MKNDTLVSGSYVRFLPCRFRVRVEWTNDPRLCLPKSLVIAAGFEQGAGITERDEAWTRSWRPSAIGV